MEDKERQRMEDFVRDLFSRTKDFNALTKKIVRKRYLKHSKKDSLNSEQKSALADIILKLLFEFNVGQEKPIDDENTDQQQKTEKSLESSDVTSSTTSLPEGGKTEPAKNSHQRSATKSEKNSHTKKNDNGVAKKDTSVEVESDDVGLEQHLSTDSQLETGVKLTAEVAKENDKTSREPAKTIKKVISKRIGVNDGNRSVRLIIKPSRDELTAIPSFTESSEDNTLKDKCDTIRKLPEVAVNNKDGNTTQCADTVTENSTDKQQKTLSSKRLSVFEVLQSVLEDSNDGSSVRSKDDFTEETDESEVKKTLHRKTPFSSMLISNDSQAHQGKDTGFEKDVTCTPNRHTNCKRLLESDDNASDSGFTPPAKVKRVIQISDSSESNNSPIRIRLFRNRVVSCSLQDSKASKLKKKVKIIESDPDSKSPFKMSQMSSDSTTTNLNQQNDNNLATKNTWKRKASCHTDKQHQSENQTTDNHKERKIVKPFRICLSKKEVLKGTDSESDLSSSPVKEKKVKTKRKKRSGKHKHNHRQTSPSSSSCDTDDLKLSQIKMMNNKKQVEVCSSDSDSDLLIKYTVGGAKYHSNQKLTENASNKNTVDSIGCDTASAVTHKLKIIHEKTSVSSDSENIQKNSATDPQVGANSICKLRIIRENISVNSESDNALQSDLLSCDKMNNELTSSSSKPSWKVRKKSIPIKNYFLSESESDNRLRIVLSSSDTENSPVFHKKGTGGKALKCTNLGKSKSWGNSVGVHISNYSSVLQSESVSKLRPSDHLVSGGNLSNSEPSDTTLASEEKNCILVKDREKSKAKPSYDMPPYESAHIYVDNSSNSDSEVFSSNVNQPRKNFIHLNKEEPVNFLGNKKLVVRLERINTASVLMSEKFSNTAPSNRMAMPETTEDELAVQDSSCNGVDENIDLDTSSLSNLSSTDGDQRRKAVPKKPNAKKLPVVPVESSALKQLKKICRAAELFVNYKKEFLNLDSNHDKCVRIQDILKKAGMKGRPTLKAAERIRLLREAKQLDKNNIISCNSGRPRRQIQSLFVPATSPIKGKSSQQERFVNLLGIVDSEGSESDNGV